VDDPTPRYTDEDLDRAIAALSEPGRVAQALHDIQAHAPQLQTVLNQALQEGGFFGTAHIEEVRKALQSADPDTAVRSLIAEETRLGMMLGVAIGLELFRELPTLGGQ
jgi:hypothetical protein